ncbi:ubiquinol-cytochrome C chaperone family protein [Roseibium polysiphoniae]|nr:ubiquinol-cytochrome C chaperone family protein [Roseibium polysiphoniae]
MATPVIMEITMLFGLFRRKKHDAELKVYSQIVAQARQMPFYERMAVPDTVDGRFDMIVVHAVLLFGRLRCESKDISDFAQRVFDVFFNDMDASLREMGVSDVRVPKKIKALGEAFYGRADAYMPALEEGDVDGLAEALTRNIYPDTDSKGSEKALARYLIAAAADLKSQTPEAIISGGLTFPDPEPFADKEEENGN